MTILEKDYALIVFKKEYADVQSRLFGVGAAGVTYPYHTHQGLKQKDEKRIEELLVIIAAIETDIKKDANNYAKSLITNGIWD